VNLPPPPEIDPKAKPVQPKSVNLAAAKKKKKPIMSKSVVPEMATTPPVFQGKP
jgi:hypothetical protein